MRQPDPDGAVLARNSLAVVIWTAVSRASGFVRVAAIAAVLGPTYVGNIFQATNTLPNLAYAALTGSLFSNLLIPPLVRRIDARDRAATQRLAGAFLSAALIAFGLVAALVVVAGPLIVRLLSVGVSDPVAVAAQRHVGYLLLVMFMPQLLLYGVVGTAEAVMNAHGRFALASAAPALENFGLIATMAAVASIYGTGAARGTPPPGEVLLLGAGGTAAVAVHAAVQWWGARRAGVTLLPRAAWREPEVRAIVRRALPSLGYSALDVVQPFGAIVVANRVPGGVVAFQFAFNLYTLPYALGARPVGVALLPRLSRLYHAGDLRRFRDELVRGAALVGFLTVPAGLAFVALPRPIADAVTFGQMAGGAGRALVALSLASLGLGVVGHAALVLATYGCYARDDTASPFLAVLVRTVLAAGGMALAFAVPAGGLALFALGSGISVAELVAGGWLAVRLRRGLPAGGAGIGRPLLRAVTASAAMVVPAYLVATRLPALLPAAGRGQVVIAAATVTGGAVFLAVQRLWRSPELALLAHGVRQRTGATRRVPWAPVAVAAGSLALVPVAVAVPVRLLLAALVALGLVVVGYLRPPAAAYVLLVATPLTAGMGRGQLVPLFRPYEALGFALGAGVALRALVQWWTTGRLPLRPRRLDLAILAMAVTGSVLPLIWLAARGLRPTSEDLLYASELWKFYGLFLLVRASIRTPREVRRCLVLSLAAGAVVAVVAILQSLDVGGVTRLVATYFSGDDPLGPGTGRGTSTLDSSIGVGDVVAIDLAICGAWLLRRVPGRRGVLAGLALLFAFGGLASGQFSGLIALAVSVLTLAVVTGHVRRLLLGVLPVAAIGAVVMRPVIDQRIADFDSSTGLPQSWTIRFENLRLFVWPRFTSWADWLFGVRPSGRIPVAAAWGPFIYIESGHTWLLWTGGVPLFLAFLYFSRVAARGMAAVARTRPGIVGVAGIGALASVLVVFVLMAFDPHLTMRGSADLLFSLLALATAVPRAATPRPRAAAGTPAPSSTGPSPARGAVPVPAGPAGPARWPAPARARPG